MNSAAKIEIIMEKFYFQKKKKDMITLCARRIEKFVQFK